jgi:hypothetical protein
MAEIGVLMLLCRQAATVLCKPRAMAQRARNAPTLALPLSQTTHNASHIAAQVAPATAHFSRALAAATLVTALPLPLCKLLAPQLARNAPVPAPLQ